MAVAADHDQFGVHAFGLGQNGFYRVTLRHDRIGVDADLDELPHQLTQPFLLLYEVLGQFLRAQLGGKFRPRTHRRTSHHVQHVDLRIGGKRDPVNGLDHIGGRVGQIDGSE